MSSYCKWPIKQMGRYAACGRKPPEGQQYCEFHSRVDPWLNVKTDAANPMGEATHDEDIESTG